MLSGLYSAAAGMAAQQAWLDNLANDAANVNTTGYRKQRLDFRDLAYGEQGSVRVGAGAGAFQAGVSPTAGPIRETGNPLDLAIIGPGFFQVRLADGSLALTRAGELELDAAGAIVTSTGERLEPPLTVPQGTTAAQLTVGPDGTVTAAGTAVGKITVVDVPAPSSLLAAGGGFYLPTQASGAPAEAQGARIQQGALEGSAVDLADVMIGVVQAQRGFELSSRALRTQDQLLEIANGIRR